MRHAIGSSKRSRFHPPASQASAWVCLQGFTTAQLHVLKQQIESLRRINLRLRAWKHKQRTGQDAPAASGQQPLPEPTRVRFTGGPALVPRPPRGQGGRGRGSGRGSGGRGSKRARCGSFCARCTRAGAAAAKLTTGRPLGLLRAVLTTATWVWAQGGDARPVPSG